MRRALLCVALVLPGCPATTTTSEPDDDPMPVAENRNGTTGSEAPLGPSYPTTSSPLPDTYVWCADPGGDACARATAALGALPIKNPANAPAQLFTLEDTYDDCVAPGMMEIRTRLDAALRLNSSGWRDQGGSQLDATQFSNIYAASGCISDVSAPVVKIAASSTSTPRTYLVRVWETASSY
jgi:hypothetical protein